MTVITNSYTSLMRTASDPLAMSTPLPARRQATWAPGQITSEINNALNVGDIVTLWASNSESFDIRQYAIAFSKLNELNGEHVISNPTNVNTLKTMIKKVIEVLNKNEATSDFEKKDIRDIIKPITQIRIDNTADNSIKKLVTIFEDTLIFEKNVLDSCTLSRVCSIAHAYADAQGSSNLVIKNLASEVINDSKAKATHILPMIQVVIQRGIPDSLEDTFDKLIDKAITHLDRFTSNEIANTFSILKQTNKLTPAQIEAFANKIMRLDSSTAGAKAILSLDSYATSDLTSLLRDFALLGYEKTDFYSGIARALDIKKLAKLSVEQLISPAWALTMSGSGKDEHVKNCLDTMLKIIATTYEGISKRSTSDYRFRDAHMTQLLWVKRGFEEADIDFPEGDLSDDLELRSEKGSGKAPKISQTQRDVYDHLRLTYPSDSSRRPGERPYIKHEPSFHGLDPDMIIQHEDRVQAVEVHGPTHYLDGRKCTRLSGKSKFKIRLLAKKAGGVANVIIIPTAAWDPLKSASSQKNTERNKSEYLEKIGLLPCG